MSSGAIERAPSGHAAKRKFWHAMLLQWRESGQAQVEFCAQRGLSIKTFCRWRTRFGSQAAATPRPVAGQLGEFLPLQLSSAVGEVEVVLAQGHRVRLSGVHAEALVRRLFEQLSC